MVGLSIRTSLIRTSTDVLIGDRSVPADKKGAFDPLLAAVRAHGNFIENVPMVFILAGIAELNGGSPTVLSSLLSAFAVARVAHVVAFSGAGTTAPTPPRAVSAIGNVGTLAGLAVYNALLLRPYWGF